ncbi:MAG: hypothetical protein HZC37_27765 [Burkholderiales bacterium]|nr:hypothetical protein [Burkholderiales bacterium]
MGRDSLMIGATMEDATAAAAPFDARYRYLAGGIRPAGTCTATCAPDCADWWGCWQDPALPPGQYLLDHLRTTAAAAWQGSARPQMPVITYYEILQSLQVAEGAAEVAAVNDAAFLGRYLDDWRFLLQRIGDARVMLHIEPDFWGFVRQVNENPHAVPAPVAQANPTDCSAHENSMAGLARCMIAMTRKYAPMAAVGLHASPWDYTVAGDGAAVSAFMVALGAADGDFVVTDPADRDAGYYSSLGQDRWWTDASAAQYLAWSRQVADGVGRPTVIWQVPLGNMAQNNTRNHWQDTRLDYLFAHLREVALAGIVALLFGAGMPDQTTPESDGGNLVARTTANWRAGGTALCQ